MKIWERGREIKGAVSLSICAGIPSGPGEVSQGKLAIRRENSPGVQSKSWGHGKEGREDRVLDRGAMAGLRQEENNEFRALALGEGVDRRWPLKEGGESGRFFIYSLDNFQVGGRVAGRGEMEGGLLEGSEKPSKKWEKDGVLERINLRWVRRDESRRRRNVRLEERRKSGSRTIYRGKGLTWWGSWEEQR